MSDNDVLQLKAAEQTALHKLRSKFPGQNMLPTWWKERLRAARCVFNDPAEVERIVDIFEAGG